MARETNIALLYSDRRTSSEERKAAFRGARRFSQVAGLPEPEEIDVSRNSVKGVRRGEGIRELSSSASPSVVVSPFIFGSSSMRESLSCLFYDRKVLGVGLSASEFLDEAELKNPLPGVPPYLLGFGLPGIGGMASLERIRGIAEDDATAAHALEILVAHEFGHAAGGLQHCTNRNCIMQENDPRDRIGNLIRVFVGENLDFCRSCIDKIRNAISNSGQFNF